MNLWLLDKAKRIQALAKTGLNYSPNHYDIERFEELYQISLDMIQQLTDLDEPLSQIHIESEKEYPTPKVDIRAVVFKENQMLLVQESNDRHWALPGGWGDIGYTPAEVAVKEVKEEAGLDVKVNRLVAVLDNRFHGHRPSMIHVYKIFIWCELLGGSLAPSPDIVDAQFFAADALPPLSLGRITPEEVNFMFTLLDNPNQEIWLD